MEVINKKQITLTIVAVVTLIALIAGATYAYFAVGVTNNFGTSTINATADNVGIVTLNGTNANLIMDLSAADMMKCNPSGTSNENNLNYSVSTLEKSIDKARINNISSKCLDVTYYASSEGKTTTPTTVTIGTASVSPESDTNIYHCTYQLTVSHSGTKDMYDWFNHKTNDTYDYTNRSAGQIILSIDGKNYDFAGEWPSTINGDFYTKVGSPVDITAGLRLVNSGSIDQTYLAGTDIQINVTVPNNGISCETVELDSLKIPENGVYLRMENNTSPKAYYTQVSNETQTFLNNLLSSYSTDLESIKDGEEFPSIQENDNYFYGDYGYVYTNITGNEPGWLAVVFDKTKTSYGELLSEINGVPLTSLQNTFANCTSLVSAPTIPNSVTDMRGTFDGCTSLAGVPIVNANPSRYTNAFRNTQITGIGGSTTLKTELYATK